LDQPLTDEQRAHVERWHRWAEKFAAKLVPFDRDAAHDIAVDSVVEAARVWDGGGIQRLLRRMIVCRVMDRAKYRSAYGGMRCRIQRIDWLRRHEMDRAIGRDCLASDAVDTADMLDHVTEGFDPDYRVVLEEMMRGSTQRDACLDKGVMWNTFNRLHSQLKSVVLDRIQRYMEIA